MFKLYSALFVGLSTAQYKEEETNGQT